MNRFTALIRRLGARQAMALALVLLVGWCSASQYLAITPAGRQCPTAAVQTVAVPVKSHCGHVIGYETRQPRPGEAEFHQCRCAEKQSNQLRDAFLVASALVLPTGLHPEVRLPIPPPPVQVADRAPTRLRSKATPPEVLPPAAA